MARFRLRRRGRDDPERVAIGQVYYGEFDRQGGGDRIWLHHAGKYLAALEPAE